MTERLTLRRQLNPGNNRGKRSLHPSPSTTRGRSKSRRNLEIKSTNKSVKSLTRCASAPSILIRVLDCKEDELKQAILECDEGVLSRGKTCGDVLSTSPPSSSDLAPSLRIYDGSCVYDKEAKVVVNVTVEGSAGPIRVMVRLGSSVEDMIHLIIQKYVKEGRRPKLGTFNDVSFELHDSYFSLQCLCKSDLIGEVGSRTFYLRTSSKATTFTMPSSNCTQSASCLTMTETEPEPEPMATRIVMDSTMHSGLMYLPCFISRRICKLIRRSCKLWKILGCFQSG